MSGMTEKLPCCNYGCGLSFEPENNDNGSCLFHPGKPLFHDAYKEWTCCNRQSVSFADFMNLVGCTLGKHSNTKPIPPRKPDARHHQSTVAPRLIEEVLPVDTRLVPLKVIVAFEFFEQLSSTTKSEDVKGNGIPNGTSCKNTGCSATYSIGLDAESCVHHPGTAVFHAGLKYWSCCKKITADFRKFVTQGGCTTGKHLWFKKELDCRLDWRQTGENVEVSISAKNYDPHKSQVQCSPVKMTIHIYFLDGEHVFEREFYLAGIVKVEESCVSMSPNTVEIKLVKRNVEDWFDLSK